MGPRDSKCDDHSTNELRKQAAAWMRDHPQRFEVLLLQIRWTSACSSPTHNREPYDTLLYCPTSCSYRSVCGTDAACRLQF